MPIRIDANSDLPLLRSVELRAIEHAAAAASPPHALMARAGATVAALARARFANARRMLVLCGPGNNGGDGMLAAAALARHGLEVELLLVAPPQRPGADWAWARQQAETAGLQLLRWQPEHARAALDRAELVLDALLGLGLQRAPDGELEQAIALLRTRHCPLLAVDCPSGLLTDTGSAQGAVVDATVTLTLLGLKPGLFGGSAAARVGELWFDDLGVAPPASALRLNAAAALLRQWPLPRQAAHKGVRGDVYAFGGAPGMGGALLLCTRSALALGAGQVFAASFDPAFASVDPMQPETMLREPSTLLRMAAASGNGGLVFGPGAGRSAAAADTLEQLLALPQPLLIDADGLQLLAAAGDDSTLWRRLRARPAPTWLTPHPGEAAALLGTDTGSVQQDRLGALRALQQRSGAGVVLKGSGSLLADRSGSIWLNASGNGLLASAGSGDVLSGAAGALLAAGFGTDGVRAAVWLHGAAADQAARKGRLTLAAGELPARIARAWAAALD